MTRKRKKANEDVPRAERNEKRQRRQREKTKIQRASRCGQNVRRFLELVLLRFTRGNMDLALYICEIAFGPYHRPFQALHATPWELYPYRELGHQFLLKISDSQVLVLFGYDIVALWDLGRNRIVWQQKIIALTESAWVYGVCAVAFGEWILVSGVRGNLILLEKTNGEILFQSTPERLLEEFLSQEEEEGKQDDDDDVTRLLLSDLRDKKQRFRLNSEPWKKEQNQEDTDRENWKFLITVGALERSTEHHLILGLTFSLANEQLKITVRIVNIISDLDRASDNVFRQRNQENSDDVPIQFVRLSENREDGQIRIERVGPVTLVAGPNHRLYFFRKETFLIVGTGFEPGFNTTATLEGYSMTTGERTWAQTFTPSLLRSRRRQNAHWSDPSMYQLYLLGDDASFVFRHRDRVHVFGISPSFQVFRIAECNLCFGTTKPFVYGTGLDFIRHGELLLMINAFRELHVWNLFAPTRHPTISRIHFSTCHYVFWWHKSLPAVGCLANHKGQIHLLT